jgi:hypothetical protein
MTAPLALPRTHPVLRAVKKMLDASVLTDDLAARAVTVGGMDSLAELAGTLYDLRQVVLFMEATVAAEILAVDLVGGQDKPYLIPTGGTLVRRGGGVRKRFDQTGLVSSLKAQIGDHVTGDPDAPTMAVTDDGEVMPLSGTVDAVVVLMVALTGSGTPSFSAWRATPCKALGVDLNRYCEFDDTPVTISVEGRQPLGRTMPGAVIERREGRA